MQGNNRSLASVVRLGMAGSVLYKGRLAIGNRKLRLISRSFSPLGPRNHTPVGDPGHGNSLIS